MSDMLTLHSSMVHVSHRLRLSRPLTTDTLRENIRDMAISLIACGIDPDRSIIFQQSMVCVVV